MEDPQVIKEIDALIDSYNWDGAQTRTEKIDLALILKSVLRNPDVLRGEHTNLHKLIPMNRFVLTQVLLKLLEYPRLRNKAWCLQILGITSGRQSRGRTIWHRKRDRLFRDAMPLFHRLLHHHRARYRLYTIFLLSRVYHNADEVATWFLDRLHRECSPHIRHQLLRELSSLSRAGTLTPFTSRKILAYAEILSRAQMPSLCLSAAIIALSVLRHRTPEFFIDNAIACWPRVGRNKEDRTIAGGFIGVIKRYHKTPTEIFDRLIANTHTKAAIGALLNFLGYDRWPREHRRILISPQMRRFLERAIQCRDVWSNANTRPLAWNARGFAPSRSRLRQQIQRCYIDDMTTMPQNNRLLIAFQGARIHVREP